MVISQGESVYSPSVTRTSEKKKETLTYQRVEVPYELGDAINVGSHKGHDLSLARKLILRDQLGLGITLRQLGIIGRHIS